VLAVALGTEITFPVVEQLKAYLEDPSAFAAAAPAASGGGGGDAEEDKQEEKKEEEEEEESDDDMGFGLFD
jgi:large subunit ribosomal protein LP0